MSKKIIIDANFPSNIRVALLNMNNQIDNLEYNSSHKQQNRGNIYLAKIVRVEPSLQAAFIEYGNEKSGFLPFSEINPDYYHIPVSDQTSSEALKAITPPNITSEDIAEAKNTPAIVSIPENDEIDIKAIERLVEDKIQSDIELEVTDMDVESISDNEQLKQQNQKSYKIQDVIKRGQVMLVQLTKEERGNKGASFTTYLSLAGKYCVLMPNKQNQNGVSRKISNSEERRRLKKIIESFVTDVDQTHSSIIIRTAGIGRTTLDIKRDYDYLVRLWNKIRETTLKSTAPCFIHEEEGIIQKTIRDMFDHHVKEFLVQGTEAYQKAQKFLREILPNETSRLKEHRSKTPIFTKFGIEDQISNLYQPVVSLQSGGYIVINPTEALTSIDVNSGKATSERNIEETALKTNLEAAREISRQVRLRDLSGILVIDFIDMAEAKNRKIIERSVREFFARDRAKIQISSISNFGLMEMSRQRLRPSFLESHSAICNHCNGKGIVRADESNAMLILRTIENEIHSDNINIVNVYAHITPILYLLHNKREEIAFIESKYNIKINFNVDHSATSDSYSIEKIKLPNNKPSSESNGPALQSASEIYNDSDSVRKNTIKHKYNNDHKHQKEAKIETQETGQIESELTAEQPTQYDSEEPALTQATANTRKRRRIYPRKRTARKPIQEPTA